MKKDKNELTAKQHEALIEILQSRFDKNMTRHKGILWGKVLERLYSKPGKLWSLNEMEKSGGEPDVVSFDKKSGEFIFYDCSPETPKGRRSICYDRKALDSRKEHKPASNAMDMAAEMGVEMLSENEYRELQKLGKFDTKTSSWLLTPDPIRKLGGAIFGDCRYDTIFIYHNGAESYYGARGFRGSLRV